MLGYASPPPNVPLFPGWPTSTLPGVSRQMLSCLPWVQVVVISGKPESVHAAEECIKRTVEERMSEREAGSVTVVVPQHAVGRIIGRQVRFDFPLLRALFSL